MDIRLPYPALTMCRECTSVDCQQASASWGQPEGHVTCLPLLKHSLQELIPPTALLSLPSLFPGVPQACQAQSPGSDLCRTCLLGPHSLDPVACSTYRAHLFCSRPGFILEGEGECGSYPTFLAACAWGQSDYCHVGVSLHNSCMSPTVDPVGDHNSSPLNCFFSGPFRGLGGSWKECDTK